MSWNFWVYPAHEERPAPADVVVAHDWPAAAARLAEGGKVLFLPGASDLDPARCPPMKNVPVFWNIQMTVRPPRNPTARFDAMLGLLCDPRSIRRWRNFHRGELRLAVDSDHQQRALDQPGRRAARGSRPIVSAIDDWNRDWRLGVIFECAVGPGKLLVSAINLEDPQAGPGDAAIAPLPPGLHGDQGIPPARRPRSRGNRPALGAERLRGPLPRSALSIPTPG